MQLDAEPGSYYLRARGSVRNFPGDVGLRASLGPRVFIPRRYVGETGLLGFGSRGRHEAYLALPAGAGLEERLVRRFRPPLAAERVSLRTVAEDQRRLGRSLERLWRFLGLVGLLALLLGGIGVASATRVLMRRRLGTVAVLRCLGASSRRVLAVYVAQALALGLAGSLAGGALGAATQLALPRLLAGLLPVSVPASPSLAELLLGVVVGLWTSAVFALLPLLAVRRVSPLLALRRDFEAAPAARDPARPLAVAALAASVAALAVLQAGSLRAGLGFALGIGGALALLAAAAQALRLALRRFVSPGLPYPWRQGLANLHRPANQTLAVVLSLGFGAFLLGTLVVVQHNLLRELRADSDEERPNLALFDIQPDQLGAVEELARAAGAQASPAVPIVTMRLQAVKGVPVSQLLAQAAASESARPAPWLLRREFRSTYRDAVSSSERVVAGRFWEPGAGRSGADPLPVSLEADVARDLGVAPGDEVVWDVQGVPVRSRVTSLREVQWARFSPNFFAVFPEGPLDQAPRTYVRLARLDDAGARARLERRVAETLPNVSALDLAGIQRSIETILDRVAWAVRFMALFSLAAGLVVLLAAVATGRQQRIRECALLKTLGATRKQVRRVVLAEYAALGSLAAATGLLLAVLGGWALARFAFGTAFALPALPLLGTAALLLGMTVGLGALASAEAFRRTPMDVLRAE